ncbi:MAG: sodium:alanine symporter family protein [Treponema sp.]|jgi:AGCS family alanine or glycine:cation symporter|nr:sodium:alanine symporter family protein [Treponema sp.]
MNFLETVQKINGVINSFVWGPYMLVLLVGTGIFFTIRTKVFQVTKIKLWWKGTFGQIFNTDPKHKTEDANITPFQAVTTALASTVGTGNIAGVATAIVTGGPGAVFWMWISGLFGMMTKYAEIVLAVKYRETDADGTYHGGPMYYIQNGLKLKWLAVVFAIFATLATFGIGNMTQANAMASSLYESFGVPAFVSGIAIALICALVIIGGIKRIALVTEKLVPFMAVFYFVGGIIILAMNASALSGAFAEIFSNAFSLQSVGGGILGYTIMRAMRYGIARGVFSNEAGLGSAPIAHAASRAKEPVEQGLWGVFEVFVDTIIICTISALIILTAGLYKGDVSGAPLVMASFTKSLGSFGGIFVTIAILCFSISTILGWSYYGQQCLHYLIGKNKIVDLAYKIFFSLLTIVGAIGGLTFVWDLADTLNGLMAIPNLIGLLLLSRVVFSLTKEYQARKK